MTDGSGGAEDHVGHAEAVPKVALIATTFIKNSHADVIGSRLIEGYRFGGQHVRSRIEVASAYIETIGAWKDLGDRAGSREWSDDIGRDICSRNGIPTYDSVAEAISCGGTGVAVDGVVIVGEHGNYERNQWGQKLYPRRRLFDSAVSTFVAGGRKVPIFVDKHLSWRHTDAEAMVRTARRLGVPLLAGSSVPLAWRVPQGVEWPLGMPMRLAVAVGYGEVEDYGFHTLEGLQAQTERREGGESGVKWVERYSGASALELVEDGVVDRELLDNALAAGGAGPEEVAAARGTTREVFCVGYADGLVAWVVLGDWGTFGIACAGPGGELACRYWLEKSPFSHFTLLVRQIEALMLAGEPPYPVERTLLTGGILDSCLRAPEGTRVETPWLSISYSTPVDVRDTAVCLPLGEL